MLATGIAFIFLSFKYVDVAARYPGRGGVVSVASDAFGPFVGCIGGILICVDYFLTGAISSVSGFQYLAAELPAAGERDRARGVRGADRAGRAELRRHPGVGAG